MFHTELARHIQVVLLQLQKSWRRPVCFKCDGVVFALALKRVLVLPDRRQLEVDQRPADLKNGRREVSVNAKEVDRALNFYERAEFRAVIFDADFAILNFEEGMRPAYTDIGNLHISLDAAADFE